MEITKMIHDWQTGDREALDQLMNHVYGELRQIAAHQLRGQRQQQSLTPTLLVHEAYLKLHQRENLSVRDRTHFFALAAHVVRGILVDHIREQSAAKRGGGELRITLDDDLAEKGPNITDITALDQGLKKLAKQDHQMMKIVELKFFGGLSMEEISQALEISQATVFRKYKLARIWLYRFFKGADQPA